jgi:hypothetical protein
MRAHEEGVADGVKRWSKDSHLNRMSRSGHFAWCRELALHRREPGTADRFVDLMRSQGTYQTLRKAGLDDTELGIPQLRSVAQAVLSGSARPWWFTYRIRLGVVPVATSL